MIILGVLAIAISLVHNAASDAVASASASASSKIEILEEVADPLPVEGSSSLLDYRSFPCFCPYIYNPVCGSDGNTYSNECILRCVSKENVNNGRPPIFVIKYGECPQDSCICPAVIQPVCGSDGHTYANECTLVCESNRRVKLGLSPIQVVSQGPCTSSVCVCSSVIIPVCGTDGRTYRNICYLQCASRANVAQGLPPIYYSYSGACTKENCVCPLDIKPVCGSDGKTYNNICLFKCENRRRNALGLPPLIVVNDGPCNSCNCPKIKDPVCASDNKTYGNPCLLKCENERRLKAGLPLLTILYNGVCGCNCNTKRDPVCGTDGDTYNNICALQCESNRRVYEGLSPIYFSYRGPCVCNCHNCSNVYQPVCGSDRRTYWNICWLECNNVCSQDQGGPPVTLVKYGRC